MRKIKNYGSWTENGQPMKSMVLKNSCIINTYCLCPCRSSPRVLSMSSLVGGTLLDVGIFCLDLLFFSREIILMFVSLVLLLFLQVIISYAEMRQESYTEQFTYLIHIWISYNLLLHQSIHCTKCTNHLVVTVTQLTVKQCYAQMWHLY